ncbi:hypothetical protein ACG2K1_06165 [Neisseria sp. 23W00296]|uniref:hypothetical protein n=1 Tax=unclassified Neisseria TaxID=2623750 RepID=UPI0037565216
MDDKKADLVIFNSRDGNVSIEVNFSEETAWLSVSQMCNARKAFAQFFNSFCTKYLLH